MGRKNVKTSKNVLLGITLISVAFLVLMVILSTVLNVYFQPGRAVYDHANEKRDQIVKEISEFTLDDNIMDKFRVVEARYGILIESILPDGDISYSTFSDEIYLPEDLRKVIRDKDILSSVPIEKQIILSDASSEEDEENNKIKKYHELEARYVINTESKYLIHETVLEESEFQSKNTLRIYFGTYEYYKTLKDSGKTRAWINAAVLVVTWAILMSVLIWTYSKIKDINIAVKNTRKNDEFGGKCPEGLSELGRLGKNINDLVNGTKARVEILSEENQRLREKLEMKKQMEDEKKDFLANAAHEMKTPLAVIQAYAEGLKMGIAKGGRARQDYCNIIMEETEKMNKLVLELLSLSKYKQKMFENIKEENISIRSFVQGVINSMNPILKENSIEIDNTINKKLIGRTDIEKASTVLSNYINNAISHTNMYRKIVISCEEKTNTYRINVFNTGDHIPEEDKKNIWDSFYRADRSHQRSEGRFGIGLSIVETIMNALGNDFGVENVYGGVQFWFEVKKPKKD